MKRLGCWLLASWLVGCAGEDVVLITVQSGGGAGQGGAAQGGAAQGGAISGGATQGGVSGTVQGGAAQGGASGMAQGGALQGGTAGSASGGDMQSGGSSSTCRSNADCDTGFCEKTRCGDDVGHCERRDVFCEGQQLAPVCGCDDVTYINDCWRRQAGVALNAIGECRTSGSVCDRSTDCQNGASCARLFVAGDRCPPGPGMCWSAPDKCGSISDIPSFVECGPTPGRCVDMCEAIHATGHPFARAPAPCSQLQP